MGQQIEPVVEDGASDGRRSPRRPRSCISSRLGRRGVRWLDVVEPQGDAARLRGRRTRSLYYPVQYEGLEASTNIFYTGATTNQQIMPALDYLKEKGIT